MTKFKLYTLGQQSSNVKFGKKGLWIVILSFLGVVFAGQLIVSSVLAGKGGELAVLQNRTLDLSRQNQYLKQELASQTSLLSIEAVSRKRGFVKPESTVYINLSLPVASIIH